MSLAIFAEGTESTDPSNNSFLSLWSFLASRAGAASEPIVQGFSKSSLVRIHHQGVTGTTLRVSDNPVQDVSLDVPRDNSRAPLDLMVRQVHDRKPFERLIIAFDREPKHNALRNKCRRSELILLLTNLGASRCLPQVFRQAATTLLNVYLSRAAPRSPKGLPLEILVMERLFEDMLLCDEVGMRNALGLDAFPKEWPSFKNPTPKPDEFIFKKACQCASARARTLVHDPKYKNKHKWAQYILQNLPAASPVWTHEIFLRLQSLIRMV